MEIVFQDSIPKVQQSLVDDLVSTILNNAGKKLLVFYSGGSVLELFPKLNVSLNVEGITNVDAWFVPVDERFDVTASNYRALAALDCYPDFEKRGVRFLDVLAHGHSFEDCAYWFSEWVRVESDQVHMGDGLILGILGMGPDGHTAGMFPYPENEVFFNGEMVATSRLAVGYDVGDKNQYRERITLTVPALMKFDRTFAYVVGANKRPALSRVVNKEGTVAATPATVWNELRACSVYTDISL